MPRSFWDWTFEGRSAKWLYVVGLVLLTAYSHYGSYVIAPFLLSLADTSNWPPFLAELYLRLTILIVLITVPLWVHFVHKRPWWSIISARPRIDWWNFGVGAVLALFALLLSHGVDAAPFGMTVRIGSPELTTFLPTLLLGFIFVFMQTTFEELIFRGYGMQAVRRFTANPVALVLGTAVLFAVVHFDNVMTIGRPWWGTLYYLSIALPLAYMVLRTGSLWMPMGFHWLFNLITTRIYAQESGA